VVQEHSGSIDVASQVGQGTTVRLLLPVRHSKNAGNLRRVENVPPAASRDTT
jgi:hypothetical protein